MTPLKFLVLLTDYADFPPHFWMEPGVDGVVVGSDHAVTQALSLGLPREKIHRVSGMILHPRFYAPAAAGRSLRGELGIPGEAFAILVLFGGVGSAEIEPLCAALLDASPDWHVVAICGRNPGLEARLQSLVPGSKGRLHPVGFTDRMPEFMGAVDLLLTKPGPGTIAEALHMGLPPLVVSGPYTVPQERFNAGFVETGGLGVVVPDWPDFPAAAAGFLKDGGRRLAEARQAIGALPRNRAVYEVLDLLGGELLGPRPGG
jgi:1,2-diacylglycerol 3-beta-galactosyltransferase